MVVFKSSVLEKDMFLSQSLRVLNCNYLHVSFYAILDSGFESCSPDKDLGPPSYFEMLNAVSKRQTNIC